MPPVKSMTASIAVDLDFSFTPISVSISSMFGSIFGWCLSVLEPEELTVELICFNFSNDQRQRRLAKGKGERQSVLVSNSC